MNASGNKNVLKDQDLVTTFFLHNNYPVKLYPYDVSQKAKIRNGPTPLADTQTDRQVHMCMTFRNLLSLLNFFG